VRKKAQREREREREREKEKEKRGERERERERERLISYHSAGVVVIILARPESNTIKSSGSQLRCEIELELFIVKASGQ